MNRDQNAIYTLVLKAVSSSPGVCSVSYSHEQIGIFSRMFEDRSVLSEEIMKSFNINGETMILTNLLLYFAEEK